MTYNSTIKPRRKPRRKKHPMPMPGAMEHNRIKDTKKRPMNAAEKAHAARLKSYGCLVCPAPTEIHHERKVNGRRDHRYLVPLCPFHHRQDSKTSRHAIGLRKFNELFTVDLVEYAKSQWEKSNGR